MENPTSVYYESTLKPNMSNEGVRIKSICDCGFMKNSVGVALYEHEVRKARNMQGLK